jgi:hypothetical protein
MKAPTIGKNASTLLALGTLAIAACDNGIGPAFWDPTPDSTAVYSLSRPELIGQPSAYDFVSLRRVVIEAAGETGQWDVALAEQSGDFVLVPSGNFTGISSRAGLAPSTLSFTALTEAPGDTAAYTGLPVPIEAGQVFAVRSRRTGCPGFGTGVNYGKLVILSIDAAVGIVRLAAVRNPYCNDRKLVPPES